jgi:hypothetical protein
MVDKRQWPKPAAWAITQNERLWRESDATADPEVIIEWSLGDSYRTHMMEPGDRAIFWITGRNGGLARVGFVLGVTRLRGGYWKDAYGRRHEAPYAGTFFMPPFPNQRYIHRDVFAERTKFEGCEVMGTAAQHQPPLRIEPTEWTVIKNVLLRFDRSARHTRSPWFG